MSRFPSIPPPVPGDPMSRRPRAVMTDIPSSSARPAVAEAPHRQSQPAQIPLNLTDKPEEPGFPGDDASIEEFLRDRHTLPKIVMAVCTAMTLTIAAIWGFRTAGASTAMTYMLMGLLALVVAGATASGAAWVVSKIFNEDFGSAGVLVLRFSAVAAAQFPVLAGLVFFLGPFPAMFVNIPIMIGVTICVAGIDLFRSIIFSIIVGVLNFMIASFALMSFSPPAS